MLVRYTILVSLTFILLSDLSRILIKMHEGSKYVLLMRRRAVGFISVSSLLLRDLRSDQSVDL